MQKPNMMNNHHILYIDIHRKIYLDVIIRNEIFPLSCVHNFNECNTNKHMEITNEKYHHHFHLLFGENMPLHLTKNSYMRKMYLHTLLLVLMLCVAQHHPDTPMTRFSFDVGES